MFPQNSFLRRGVLVVWQRCLQHIDNLEVGELLTARMACVPLPADIACERLSYVTGNQFPRSKSDRICDGLANEVRALVEALHVGGNQTRAVFQVF